ncbi:mitochondrial biogenesis AIM24-domain-containing protein [Mucor mucedo]|uniref:mitochondrial biogenesis AIM24-domain-containing protein n=1 Tax=Mucor mucedo TaxID=29922 RepID=UPI00221E874F|nr:mitochondrial biogenesis AIM24-domain-containing protein [Mucor mucedo]KAI7884979.1 mitochondrial biogenesis AIM24-domain-containing protein [Mucor mucedo]
MVLPTPFLKWEKASISTRKFKTILFLKLYLLALLPPDSEITAITGSALGSSTRVGSKLALDTTTVKALGRRIVGDAMFYQKYYTKNAAGDILLAPQTLGEITTIPLKTTAKYILRRDAFLAKTEKVTFDLGLNKDSVGLVNKLVHTVSGPGTLAISHYGGLYRISLAAGEEYQANPRNLIMWDKRTNPSRLHPAHPVVPSPRSKLRQYEVIRNIVDSPSLQPKLQYVDTLAKAMRNYLMGAPDFVKLKGPGDFYLTSRVQPRFEKSRLMNALAAANDSAAQLFEQSSIFPSVPESEFIDYTKKKHPGYAQKSTDGFPSCYAVVGPKGAVAFTPATREENV